MCIRDSYTSISLRNNVEKSINYKCTYLVNIKKKLTATENGDRKLRVQNKKIAYQVTGKLKKIKSMSTFGISFMIACADSTRVCWIFPPSSYCVCF